MYQIIQSRMYQVSMYSRKSSSDFVRVFVTFIASNTAGQACRFVFLFHILEFRVVIVDPEA
jgi:hypothetical protein